MTQGNREYVHCGNRGNLSFLSISTVVVLKTARTRLVPEPEEIVVSPSGFICAAEGILTPDCAHRKKESSIDIARFIGRPSISNYIAMLAHRKGIFVLDRAFAVIEGHPPESLLGLGRPLFLCNHLYEPASRSAAHNSTRVTLPRAPLHMPDASGPLAYMVASIIT